MTDLRGVLVLIQAVFSLGLATVLALAPRVLLSLGPELGADSAQFLFICILLSGALAGNYDWLYTKRLNFLLGALASGDQAMVDHQDVLALNGQARRSSLSWLLAHLAVLTLLATPLRPELMDLTTALSLMLLSGSIAVTAALALYATLRQSFLRAIDRVSPYHMAEIVLKNESRNQARHRIGRRLLIAVLIPTLFVALGSALIANSHVRSADERSREHLAQLMSSTVFAPSPAAADVGLQGLHAKATELGFPTRVLDNVHPRTVRRLSGGIVEVSTPLEDAYAITHFNGSTVGVLSRESLLLLGLAVSVATALALALGGALSRDLQEATEQVQRLGTSALTAGPAVEEHERARFRIVGQLQRAIGQMATRFRVFAMAQQDAIEARSAATRMRGQFFASVSHDLRGPLNSILGFTELVRMEPMSEGQSESLKAVLDRGHELLTLIETILDAARVEVGQLSLMLDEVTFEELYSEALEKAERLSGGVPLRIYEDIEPDLPNVLMDRMRGARALAAFIAYSVRATGGRKMWVRAERQGGRHLRIDVDVPATRHSADELNQMLETTGAWHNREHRGLTLALQLANAVVKLHGGYAVAIGRGAKGAMFCITLPVADRHPEAEGDEAADAEPPATDLTPNVDPPGVDEPDTREPDTREPDTREPDTREPDTREPDTREPDTREPDTRALDTGAKPNDPSA